MTTIHSPLASAAQGSWRRFLETYEPLRSDLYRYCRFLTRSPWDAEDLAQDALARAFVTLARMGGQDPTNPRAWLFRIASNLWIDQRRRLREITAGDVSSASPEARPEPQASREAAGTLLVALSPQERAAVVLKDVFDFSLEEVAEALETTVGAVKTALHRGRGKLAEEPSVEAGAHPVPAAVDAFCAAFNAGDLDRLTAVLLDSSVVEVVGATTQYGPAAARRTVLTGMLFGVKRLADPNARALFDHQFEVGLAEPPRVEPRLHRGRWIVLHWYRHVDGEAIRAVTLLDLEGDRVAHLRNYFFNVDFLRDIAGELGLPVRVNGHRSWTPEVAS